MGVGVVNVNGVSIGGMRGRLGTDLGKGIALRLSCNGALRTYTKWGQGYICLRMSCRINMLCPCLWTMGECL